MGIQRCAQTITGGLDYGFGLIIVGRQTEKKHRGKKWGKKFG